MNSIGVRLRLGIVFSVVVALLIVLGLVSLNRMAGINSEVQDAVTRRLHMVQLSREALSYSSLNNRLTMQIFLMDDRKQIDQVLALRAVNTDKISELLKEIESNVDSSREGDLLANVRSARGPYVNSYLAALNLLLKDGKPDIARARMVQITLPDLAAYHKAWEDFVDYQGAQMDDAVKVAQAHYLSARATVINLLLVATLVAIGVAVFAIRSSTVEMAGRQLAEQRVLVH